MTQFRTPSCLFIGGIAVDVSSIELVGAITIKQDGHMEGKGTVCNLSFRMHTQNGMRVEWVGETFYAPCDALRSYPRQSEEYESRLKQAEAARWQVIAARWPDGVLEVKP